MKSIITTAHLKDKKRDRFWPGFIIAKSMGLYPSHMLVYAERLLAKKDRAIY